MYVEHHTTLKKLRRRWQQQEQEEGKGNAIRTVSEPVVETNIKWPLVGSGVGGELIGAVGRASPEDAVCETPGQSNIPTFQHSNIPRVHRNRCKVSAKGNTTRAVSKLKHCVASRKQESSVFEKDGATALHSQCQWTD